VTSQLADVVVSTPVTSLALATQLPEVVTNMVADPRMISPQAVVSAHPVILCIYFRFKTHLLHLISAAE